jgi:hypothetical protein
MFGSVALMCASIVAIGVSSVALVAYACCWLDVLQLLVRLFGSAFVLLYQDRCLCVVSMGLFATRWLSRENYVGNA